MQHGAVTYKTHRMCGGVKVLQDLQKRIDELKQEIFDTWRRL